LKPQWSNEEKLERIQAIKARLWQLGDLEHLLHSGQLKIQNLKPERNLALVNCSRQWGKTRWACTQNLADLIKHPGIINKYGSSMYEDLKKYIYPNMREIINMAPREIQKRVELQEGNKRLIVRHGSKVSICDFVGLDRNPDGMRGNKVHRFTVEEAGYVKNLMYVWFDVIFPMFTHMPNAMCYMIGTPSDSPDHEFVSYFMPRAIKENAYLHETIDDNPLLDDVRRAYLKEEYFIGVNSEAMRRAQDSKMRRELYGEVVVDYEQAIIPEFEEDRNVMKIEKDQLFKFYHKYIAMDLGVVDKTVALFYYYDFQTAKVRFTHERVFHGPTMTTEEIAKGLKEKEIEAFGEHKVYRRVSDNDNLLLIADLGRLHGIHFSTTNKESLHAMVNKVRLWMDQGRIEIDESCTELIGCLKNGLWDNNRKQFARSATYGHFDAVAALVYAIRNIDEHSNPIPPMHQLDANSMFIPQDTIRKQGNVETYEKMFPGLKQRRKRK